MSDINKYSILDIDGAADVVNNLLDKLGTAVGWGVNRETPERIAIATYIEDIKNSDYDSLLKAALISQAKKTIKEYCNQKDVVGFAINELREGANPQKVDDDWIVLFMDQARLISDEVFQSIWGKILAEECNDNNSIPKKLLYTLAQMDREDAETFTTLCSLAVKVDDEYEPVIWCHRLDEYKKWGITFDKIISLIALGLIEADLVSIAAGYVIESESNPIKVHYFDSEYEMEKETKTVRVGNVLFTKQARHCIERYLWKRKRDFLRNIVYQCGGRRCRKLSKGPMKDILDTIAFAFK